MAYNEFTLEAIEETFELKEETNFLFQNITPINPTSWLLETLQKAKLMPAKSKKARSELLITPVLLTLAEQNSNKITIFSGENLEGDSEKGLNGECDYILSKSLRSFSLKAPVFALVEAKQNIIENSMGQCVAQMLGAQFFNQKKKTSIPVIYGCVSNGEIWQFLRLENKNLTTDTDKYYLNNLPELLGVLQVVVDDLG